MEWTPKPELTYVSDFPVATDLTERLAQAATIEHLRQTVRLLPAELSLVTRDRWDGRAVGTSFVDTCTLDDRVPDAPLGLWLGYLVVGGTRPARDYLPEFRSAWQYLGWPVEYAPNVTPNVVKATTPDHYTLTVSAASTGDLGVDVASPCFPNTGRGGADPLPPAIPHP